MTLAGTTIHKNAIIQIVANPNTDLIVIFEFVIDEKRFTACFIDDWYLIAEKTSPRHTKQVEYTIQDKIPQAAAPLLLANMKQMMDNIGIVNTKWTKYL